MGAVARATSWVKSGVIVLIVGSFGLAILLVLSITLACAPAAVLDEQLEDPIMLHASITRVKHRSDEGPDPSAQAMGAGDGA
jgi:hypothetical protein